MDSKIHAFSHSIQSIPLPERFTFPFHYTPHPLCVLAAEETQEYLKGRTDWTEELRSGKMFGVLVVQSTTGSIGYLAAFSGNLAGKNHHSFFVPPIYDLLQPDGFFRVEEEQITTINHTVYELQTSTDYAKAQHDFQEASQLAKDKIDQAKAALKSAKLEREKKREKGVTPEEEAVLIRESQFQKAEFKRLERALKESVEEHQQAVTAIESRISALKHERKSRSAALQLKLFEQFRILNAKGEIKDLCEIFAPTSQGIPPAGAGECAAPKLLQYAYLHQLKPIAMAEFWWGNSPKTEIRHHGYYYPACQGKCGPILGHMLQGLEVDENPLLTIQKDVQLEILYEDEWIVAVNKPAGMLSVPGKNDLDSVYQRLHRLHPQATGPLIVHRLDMATSGILVVAKTKEAHQLLQAQFEKRTVTKRYIALLEGIITKDEGEISLPLCADPLDRPRQIVSEEFGKTALTRYKVLRRENGKTYIAFYPLTGRTHQLRVHAAHPQGLNYPIVGDTLYGKKADRLYLHAEFIAFTHPITGKHIEIHCSCPFLPATLR